MKTEQLYAALDLISKGITQPTKIARALGISYRNYRLWLVASNAGDPKYLIEGDDGEVVQWAKAVSLATKLALYELRGMVLQEAIYGYDEVQTFQGQRVWALDPAACAIDDLDLREMLYGRRDGLLVIDGKLQPLVLKKKAPFAQQIRLLEAAFPDLRPSQTINQNVAVNGQVGIAYAKPVDYSKPLAIPPLPPVPELPAPTDAEFSEVDEDLDDLLGPEPEPVAIRVLIEPQIMVSEVEPAEDIQPTNETPRPITDRTIRDTPSEREKIAPATEPTNVADVPLRNPRSPLEADLFAKLAEARARPPRKPQS
jgi:hypothetical protein